MSLEKEPFFEGNESSEPTMNFQVIFVRFSVRVPIFTINKNMQPNGGK